MQKPLTHGFKDCAGCRPQRQQGSNSGQLNFNTRDGLVPPADHTVAREVETQCSRPRATISPSLICHTRAHEMTQSCRLLNTVLTSELTYVIGR